MSTFSFCFLSAIIAITHTHYCHIWHLAYNAFLYDTVFRVPGIVDVPNLITDQRITIHMAIQQLQQLTPYWWAVGEAAGMQRAALKEVSVILSLLSVLCTSICSAVYLSNCTTMCTYSLSSRYRLTTRGMQKSHLRR